MSREEKNAKIKATLKETLARHSLMDCRVYEVKVTGRKLSFAQAKQTNQMFREAKWMYNYCLSDVKKADTTVRSIPVKVKDEFETRELTILSSQMKQGILTSIKSALKSLHKHKLKGDKVGKLKFKSVCNSIPLKQYGNTYRIDFDRNRIKVQNINKPFYVKGLNQIPRDADICNAVFIRKASGLYFHITVYEYPKFREKTGKQVGIDFGIEHNLTTSDGNTYDVSAPESKGLKLAQKRINRSYQKNGKQKSKNHWKRVKEVRIASEKVANKRIDQANKIVHHLKEEYDFIAIQDEMIHNWHSGLFGKQVQYSAMGTIKVALKNSANTYVVERSFPSTQLCPVCGCKTKHPLIKRTYNCPHCGYHHDSRDIKSAQSILDEALRQVSLEQRAKSPVEAKSTTLAQLCAVGKVSPMKQEAQVL